MTFLAAGNIHFAHCAMLLRIQARPEPPWRGVSNQRLAAIVERYTTIALPDAPLPPPADQPAASLAGSVARLAIALQRAAGLDVAGWRELPGPEEAAIFVCADQATGQAAGTLALRALTGEGAVGDDAMTRRLADAARPWVRPLARAAVSCGIPMTVVLHGDPHCIALGHGRKRHLYWRNFTSATCHIGTVLTTNKNLAAVLLRDAGLPAPRNLLVRDVAEAVRAADRLGYPVVIKPAATDYGRGVSTGISAPSEVAPAFTRAQAFGTVIVEQQIAGDQHRLLVINGRCVTVSRLLPARVIGDGVSSVARLVEIVNESRAEHLSAAGVKIKLDEMAAALLHRQDMTTSSVPALGQVVLLRSNANLSTGGTGETMTDVAHPEVLRLAERAALLFGLDFAGIDYLTSDVTRSPQETGGAICEVNVTPGWINMGDPVALTRELLSPVFPPGEDGRIPTLCVLAPLAAPHSLTDGLALLFEGQVARTDQVRFWSGQANPAPAPLHRRVSAALADPLAGAVLIPCAPDDVAGFGLGLESCAVTILMPGVTGPALEAVLRVTQVAVVAASVAASMPEVIAAAACRLWMVGEPPIALRTRCAGWIRRAEGGALETCTAAGVVWRMTDPAGPDEHIFLVAAGVALNLPPARVATAIHAASARNI